MIGAGLIAPIHAAGIQEMAEQAEVTAVCDVDPRKAQDLATLFNARVYTDYPSLIQCEEVDLVFGLLPHHLHYPVAMATLEARKHLYLEKPVATTYPHSLEIAQKARQAGVSFGVAENTRFIKAYIEAKKMLQSGALGKILLVRTFLPANERIRLGQADFWGKKASLGGGALIDSAPHTFYLLKWLFGDIQDLAAYTSQIYRVDSEVEDNAVVLGRLANGAEFSSSFSFTTEIPHSERLEIYGSSGTLIIDQLSNPPAKFYTDPMDFDGSPLEGVEYDPMGWHYFSVVEGVKDFIASVWENRPAQVDVMDCCYAVRVIEKAYQSMRNNHQLVTV
jgi:UDP-N-acetyl-2-amino-2-deoxyglucuronate dehydrogenase